MTAAWLSMQGRDLDGEKRLNLNQSTPAKKTAAKTMETQLITAKALEMKTSTIGLITTWLIRCSSPQCCGTTSS